MKVTRCLLAALLGAVTLVALSCGAPTPVGVDSPAPPSRGDLILGPPPSGPVPSGLLQCSSLPSATVTQTIGPEGGTLQVGLHTLSVPPGALAAPVSITALATSDTVNRVEFQPAGLTFNQPAALTMSYANCGRLGSLLPTRIAYTTDALAILEYLPSVDDLQAREVTGRVEHFSTYAIAW
jgi:hypothetical protein